MCARAPSSWRKNNQPLQSKPKTTSREHNQGRIKTGTSGERSHGKVKRGPKLVIRIGAGPDDNCYCMSNAGKQSSHASYKVSSGLHCGLLL